MNPTRDRSTAWLLVILLITGAAYWPALGGDFVYDDFRFVRDNPAIRDLGNVPRFFSDPTTLSANEDRDIYRPLRTLSFAIDHQIVGDHTTLYHVENLLFHLATVVVLYRLLEALRWLDPPSRLLATCLYSLHPAATEAVAWISSRGDVMAGCFFMLACWLYVKRSTSTTPSIGTRLLLVVLAALAVLAKEFAVMLPAACFLLQVALREPWRRRQVLDIAVVTAVMAGYIVLRQTTLATENVSQIARQGADERQHYLYVARGLAEYLRLTVFPHPLTVDYGDHYFALPSRLFLIAAAALLALLVLLALGWRERAPWLWLGLAWFFVTLLPTSNLVIRVKALVAERFLYLPLIGIVLAVVSSTPVRLRRLLFLLAIPLAATTFARCQEWRTQERLFTSAIEVWPGSIQARMALANLELARGATDSANRRYGEVLQRTPRTDTRHLEARYELGRQAFDHGDFDSAVAQLRAVHVVAQQIPTLKRRLPCYGDVLFLLGEALRKQDATESAVVVLEELVALDGRAPRSLLALGRALDLAGHTEAARAALEEAVEKAPREPLGWLVLGLFRDRHGERERARQALSRVLDLDPGNSAARAALERLGS